MRAVSIRKQRSDYSRAKAERALGRDALMGTCACCGRYGYVNGHERLGRAQGGDASKPDCLACPLCNTLFETEPIWAAWEGWKINKKYSHDPKLADNEARCLDGSIHTFQPTAMIGGTE